MFYKIQLDILPMSNAKMLCSMLPENASIFYAKKGRSAIVFINTSQSLTNTCFELVGEQVELMPVKSKPNTSNLLGTWKSVKSF